jgi:peroxiredoxin family protein
MTQTLMALSAARNTTGEFEQRLAILEKELDQLRASVPDANKVTLLAFSGNLDKLLAGLIVATTAASLGMEVTVFFTFWGINALKQRRLMQGKGVMSRAIDLMTPAGPDNMPVSQLDMLGAGRVMLRKMMADKGMISPSELLQEARQAGVKLIACSMTMQVMDIRPEELDEDIEVAGAAGYLMHASRSGCTLFV